MGARFLAAQEDDRQRVGFGVDGCQRLSVPALHDGEALTDEAREVLADVEVLHLAVRAPRKVALDDAPLVAVLLHVLPVEPGRGPDVAHVVDESLSHVQVALDAPAAAARLAHPYRLARFSGQVAHLPARLSVGRIGVGVPLAYQVDGTAPEVLLQHLQAVRGARLVAGADGGPQAALLQDGSQHAEERHLALGVEVTTLLRARLVPVVRGRFVEGLQRPELDAVRVPIVQADVHQIAGEVLVAVGAQVVRQGILVPRRAAADGHPPGRTVREGFEDGVRALLLYLEHDAALCRVALPVVRTSALVLEALHLGPQAFPLPHVVHGAVRPRGVVAAADVVAEDVPVQTVGADHPVNELVDAFLVPFAAHIGPPAQAHAPSLHRLAAGIDVHSVLIPVLSRCGQNRQEEGDCQGAGAFHVSRLGVQRFSANALQYFPPNMQ